VRRSQNSVHLHNNVRRNDFARQHPNQSFSSRNKGVTNRSGLNRKGPGTAGPPVAGQGKPGTGKKVDTEWKSNSGKGTGSVKASQPPRQLTPALRQKSSKVEKAKPRKQAVSQPRSRPKTRPSSRPQGAKGRR